MDILEIDAVQYYVVVRIEVGGKEEREKWKEGEMKEARRRKGGKNRKEERTTVTQEELMKIKGKGRIGKGRKSCISPL